VAARVDANEAIVRRCSDAVTTPRVRRATLALVPLLAAGWLTPAPSLRAGDPDAVAVVAAYVAAWNAHDLDAAMAVLAPDAVIRYRGPGVPDLVWASAHLGPVAGDEGRSGDPGSIAVVDGTAAIRAHLRAEFGWGVRVETEDLRATAHGAAWTYRLSQDPDRRLLGVGPVEGRAEARVRAGRITHLSVAPDTASADRRTAAVAAALARRRAAPADPTADAGGRGPGGARSGARGAGTGEPMAPETRWALLFGGLAAGAALLARRRRCTLRRPGLGPRLRSGASAAVRTGGALAVLWGSALAGCGPAGTDARGGAPVLYVGNAGAGTVTRVSAADGRPLGPAAPVGAAPWQVAVGASDTVLVWPAPGAAGTGLTFATPSPAGWQVRPVPLEPGARDALLAGGGRFAAVAYRVGAAPAGARCRVALVDLERGDVAAARDVCAGRESVAGIAAGGDDALVYLALWRRPAADEPCGGATGSRVTALRLDTGAAVATAPLDGVPGPLALAPGPGGAGRRLYAAEALPAPEVARPGEPLTGCELVGYGELFEGAPGWRVRELDATTLAADGDHAVPYPVRALAATPDGGDAFVLAGRADVLRLRPGGGPAAPLAVLPDVAMSLAATDARVYTLGVFRDRVWGLDRRRGALVQTIPTGRHPLGIAIGGSARP
jgi:hypothetical protein